MKQIDTTNMCSHLQRKLFDGEYRAIREQIETDPQRTPIPPSEHQSKRYDTMKIALAIINRIK